MGLIAGSGGVGGSTGATDNAITRADGTGGATIQSSGITISDANKIVIPDGSVALDLFTLYTGNFLGINAGMYIRSTGGFQFVSSNSIADILFVRDGGFNVPGAGHERVAADATNATATMSNLSDLTATLEAGRHYTGELVIKCQDSVAAEGIKFDFDGGTATMTAFAAGAGILTGGTAVAGTTVSSALATDLTWTTITNETWITIKISMTVNAGGTFIPRFAQDTHTAGTATVYRGTYLLLHDNP